MGLPMWAGRSFSPQDTVSSPKVAVINETMARLFFPGVSPLGHRFGFGDDPAHSADFEVVGVVKDAKYVAIQEGQKPAAYFPYSQHIQYLRNFAVRFSGGTGQMIPEVRRAIAEVSPDIPIGTVTTLADQVDDSMANQRLVAQLSTFFGLLAMFLVCIGIYGLMSYAVNRRRNEIGIRMALGASRSNVLWLIMREALLLVVAGLAIGVPIAFGGAHLVAKLEDPHIYSSLLFHLGPDDPISMIAAIIVMLVVAVAAGYFPARRASTTDPMVALRYE